MKFNEKRTIHSAISHSIEEHPDLTQNHEGGVAFDVSPELELYLLACTCLFEDKFYESSCDQASRLIDLIGRCDRDFVLKLAMFARKEMYLRSIPIALVAEASRLPRGESEKPGLLRHAVRSVCTRADQPAEMLAYLKSNVLGGTKRKMPYAVKRGLSDALNRFNEYQLQKWDIGSREFKLRDVIRIVHPSPKGEVQSDLFKRAIAGELKTANTWETYISEHGSSAETWDHISADMPIMAIIRNLRNFEKHGAKKAIARALELLRNPEVIRNSKQFPFRWWAAEKAVSSIEMRDALREALELSVENIPRWDGSTAIFVDVSGSMMHSLSDRSTMTYVDVASMMGALALHLSKERYLVGAFARSYKDVPLFRKDSVLTNVQRIMNTQVGHSTNAFLCLDRLIRDKLSFDRIFIFSDMQCYDSRRGFGTNAQSLQHKWLEYQAMVNPKAVMYSVDLAGHGTTQFPQDGTNVVQVAGWSESIFKFIGAYEERHVMLEHIMKKY